MRRPVLAEITTPYSAVEALLYDALIAPAVLAMKPDLVDELLGAIPRGARVIEVGSGGGQLAIHVAAARPDLRIAGVDLSPQQVARATRRARAVAERVAFQVGSALDLPFPDDAGFDAAVSVGSIKHWPDPARGLAEMLRVLRPGGRLAVIEVDRGCRIDDARAFVARTRVPRLLREPMVMMFRTYVAGQGVDADDARGWASSLGLVDAAVTRLDGAPALVLTGRKPG